MNTDTVATAAPVISTIPLTASQRAPRFEVADTEYGVAIGARRTQPDGRWYWRITQFLMPFYTMPPTDVDEKIVHMAGAKTPHGLTVDELCRLVRDAGREPVQRDSVYNVLHRFEAPALA